MDYDRSTILCESGSLSCYIVVRTHSVRFKMSQIRVTYAVYDMHKKRVCQLFVLFDSCETRAQWNSDLEPEYTVYIIYVTKWWPLSPLV